MEDFRWEEYYVFGPGYQKEYEKLKKKNPSYTDHYQILTIVTTKTCYRVYGRSLFYAYIEEKKYKVFFDLNYILVGLCPNCAR
jgi:hypothetical protein